MTATILAYAFVVGQPVSFDVNVQFQGWIPIFGGREGKATVNMTVVATAVKTDEIESYIPKIDAEAFGVQLPLNSSNVDQFFPKAVATIDTFGSVKSNTAPAIKMPAKLPGLDSQRLPEISFLPLELPKTQIKPGESYPFVKTYGGQEFKYVVTLASETLTEADFSIKLTSVRDGFEDAYGNPIDSKKGAKKTLHAVLNGTGKAKFSKTSGCFDLVEVETNETTTTEPLNGGATATKKLKTLLKIKRKTS
jgi:hypothetical protein